MDEIKLNVLTPAQYQFLDSRDPAGYYDNRTREQLYRLIDQLAERKKSCTKEEAALYRKFAQAEFGILLPPNRKTTGPLKFKASLCINGEHEGEVNTGGTLIVGDQGSVVGNIIAGEVICRGKITGDVAARIKLTLYSTGTLEGDLVAPAVQVAPGALFKGKCRLGNPQTPSAEKPQGNTAERPPITRRLGRIFKAG